MDLVFPNVGLAEQLERILTDGVTYHLYTNNVTPTRASILTDFTEAIFSGYGPHFVALGDWTLLGVSGNAGYAIAAPLDFPNSSGSDQSCYGYYVTDSGSTILLAAAMFDGPPVTVHNGDSFSVVPTWGDFSQLP